ncbi:MAG: hypothetical protein CMI60_22625 [Parvibaculum sp.]|nr:hypothetical protein [Parvibaculum sp.]
MSLSITTTSKLCSNRGTSIVLSGPPKVGKSFSLRTLPGRALVVDIEDGQLCNQNVDLPAVQIRTWADAEELLVKLKGDPEWHQFDCIAVDSISELAEVRLSETLGSNSNKMAAYGQMADDLTKWLKEMARLSQHIIFLCKYQRNKAGVWTPLFPGSLLEQNLFFWMDEILVMRMVEGADGKAQRVIQCNSCEEHQAGDRSGTLDFFEAPDLTNIITKIMSGAIQQ